MAIQGFFTGDVKIRDLNGVLKAVDGIVEVATDAGTVTSVGLIVGSTGTDVNVANSPITSSGNITLNLPTASATNRGLLSSADWTTFNNKQAAGNYVTLDTYQTITASKTFSVGFNLASVGGTNQPTFFENTNNLHSGSVGSNIFGFNTNNNIYFGKGSDNGGVLSWNNSEVRYYTLPNANGTIALVGGSGVGTVTSIATTGPITGGTITSTGTIGITQATTSTDGYLSSTDWNTFNNKQGALTLTTTGSSGAATLVGTTLNIPNYGSVIGNYVPYTGATSDVNLGVYTLSANSLNVIGVSGAAGYLGLKQSLSVLYGGGGYTSLTGEDKVYLSMYFSQDSLGTNYKLARFNASALTNNTQRTYSLPDASGTLALTSDLTGYVTAVTASSPLFSSGGTTPNITIQVANTSQNGYLSSTDWNTFNNKQAAGSYITALTGEATASGPGSASVTLSTSAVTGKLLTGLNLTGGGTIAATDSILQAFGKVQNQISGMVGGVTFQGTWDASTNTPTLTSSVGTKGYYYIVDVAGSTNLNGITDWKVGDWAIFNGSTWDKVDNTDAVSSVNGFTGAVSLTTSNIAEGTNLYYLDSRARLALSFTAGSGAYDNTTGVITIPTNTSQLTNGANFITLSSLSASSPLAYNNGTGAFSIQVANGSQNGYLSSTDWTTFNSKQAAGNYVTTDTVQTITARKTFSDLVTISYIQVKSGSPTGLFLQSFSSNQLEVGATVAGTTYYSTLTFPGSSRNFTFPAASGTIALTSDIPSLSGYVPYTGATANLDLGTYSLSAYDLIIDHTSGSGVAASITKGGNGEALTVVKSSGSGNAASITGGVTLLSELHLTTDLADAYIASATNWNTAYSLRITSATSPLSITSNVISIAQASGSTNGYLSSTDWTTFNSKQNALTNPVTGTGTTNYLPKFTGASTIGNSIVSEGSGVINIGTTASTTYGTLNIIQNSIASPNWVRGIQIVHPNGTGITGGYISISNIGQKLGGIQVGDDAAVGDLVINPVGGNLGLGVTPSAWTLGIIQQIGTTTALWNYINTTYLTNNRIFSSGNKYITNGFSTSYEQDISGNHVWLNAPSGIAGAAMTMTSVMTLNASGNLSIGNTNDTYKLDVTGTGRFTLDTNKSITTYVAPSTWSGISDYVTGGVGIAFSRPNDGVLANAIFTFNGAGDNNFAISARSSFIVATGGGLGGSTQALKITDTGAATFSSSVTSTLSSGIFLNNSSGGTNATQIRINNTGGDARMGIESSTGGTIQIGTSAYSAVFGNQANAATEFTTNGTVRMSILGNGNVGIGTTSPSGLLDLGAASNGNALTWSNYSNIFSEYSSGALWMSSNFYANVGSSGYKTSLTATFGAAAIKVSGTSGSGNSGLLQFYVDDASSKTAGASFTPTERMRITSSGKVLIGKTSASGVARNLEVQGQLAATAGSVITEIDSYSAGATNLGYIGTQSNHDLAIKTNDTERMRITSGGNVGIGIAGFNSTNERLVVRGSSTSSSDWSLVSQDSSGNQLFRVRNDGLMFALPTYNSFTTSSAANLVIFSDGSIGRSTSSLKYKNNVRDYDKGLDIINQMRPVYYNGKNDGNILFAGLIAEEIHDLGLTEFVQYAKDGTPDALSYSNMVSLLIKGMQELKAELDTLKNK